LRNRWVLSDGRKSETATDDESGRPKSTLKDDVTRVRGGEEVSEK